MNSKPIHIIIITGLSGSGKSTAMAALEDAGYYCVDNMPVALLPAFMKLQPRSDVPGFAFVMDLREKRFLDTYEDVFNTVKRPEYRFEILYFEASEKVLVQRYSQTRRTHPLAVSEGVLNGIRTEKQRMEKIKRVADVVIDTSNYTVHELKALVFEMARENGAVHQLQIHVLTFGFKYSIPSDADLVADVRFLQNPYFIPHLKPLDGRTDEIQAFVFEQPEASLFLTKYIDLLDFLIPLYEREGKSYLTIAIGCTGGRHRSVAIACRIHEHFHAAGRRIKMTHRDINHLS